MPFPFSLLHTSLAILAFLTLPCAILARVAIQPLSLKQFFKSFSPYYGSEPGSCGRPGPNGGLMMKYVLKSLGGANAIAQTAVLELPTYPTQINVRGLLFLFFGITFLEDHQINPDPDQGNVLAYQVVLNTFTLARQVFVRPNPQYAKPRYRCLEDFASYYQHDVGTDGRENMSAPLIAEMLDFRMSNGSYYPGLMYVYNQRDGSSAWYPGPERNPSGGGCALGSNPAPILITNAYKHWTPISMRALYGITACPGSFSDAHLLDLQTPTANGGYQEVKKFAETSDIGNLHEIIHLISLGVITDVHAVYPPNSDWWSRAWQQWYQNPATGEKSYGYLRSVYLALAIPSSSRLNAENYAIFALCIYFPELACLGVFQVYVQTKRDIPLETSLSRKAIARIRAGKFDLTKDLPMDTDLEQQPERGPTPEDDDVYI